MKYGSVCSGIEAATSAWHGFGWTPEFFSEIEPFPSAVLGHHYPEIPNHGDMTKYKEWPNESIDLLVGGTPCQSFSVAGLRKGLDDPRGNLALVYLGIVDKYRPQWVVWENVPGVRSSWSDETAGSPSEESRRILREDRLDPEDFEEVEQTNDLDCFTAALGELGYGWAKASLDAQYFGVAQRRERVFVVGYLGDWRRAAAVLFERESLSGDSPPSREKREEVAGTITSGLDRRRGSGIEPGTIVMSSGQANAEIMKDKSPALNCNRDGSPIACFGIDEECNVNKDMFGPLLRGGQGGTRQAVAIHGTQDPCVSDIGFALGRNGGQENAVCFAQNSRDELREMPYSGALSADPEMKQTSYLRQDMQVRRLTPIECERLQGFPDNYTRIPWRNKSPENCPDGPRYKALGNSMAVPVMKWIGERIQHIEGLNT